MVMDNDPDEKLIGHFTSRSYHLHLLRVSTGYRMDSFDKDDVSGTISQAHYSDLQNAQVAFCMKLQELLATA
jgi:hypothetical protein